MIKRKFGSFLKRGLILLQVSGVQISVISLSGEQLKDEDRDFIRGNKSEIIEYLQREMQFPLSYQQRRIYFSDKFSRNNIFFNLTYSVDMFGSIDSRILAKSISIVAQNQLSLKTSFFEDGTQLVQKLNPELSIPLDIIKISAADVDRKVAELSQYVFDLSKPPLISFTLLQLEDQHSILVIVQHHIITDGWSISILLREISQCYRTIINNEPLPTTQHAFRYVDYANFQQAYLNQMTYAEAIAYWAEKLEG